MNLRGYISITTFMLLMPSIESLNSLRKQIKEYNSAPNSYINILGGRNQGENRSRKANLEEIVKNIKEGGGVFKNQIEASRG